MFVPLGSRNLRRTHSVNFSEVNKRELPHAESHQRFVNNINFVIQTNEKKIKLIFYYTLLNNCEIFYFKYVFHIF